jgi:hypothetical protein
MAGFVALVADLAYLVVLLFVDVEVEAFAGGVDVAGCSVVDVAVSVE